MEERDLIIIGAGPAGLTAGIYGIRAELKTLVIESKLPGGQIATAGEVENYPGFPEGIMGMELAENMRLHAENAGVEIRSLEEVQRIERGNGFTIHTPNAQYKAKAVIIATGLEHRKLGIPGEKEFAGKGVSYCFTCDGPLYRGRKVVVVGAGTGAVQGALYLDDLAKEVTIITKSEKVRTAEAIMKSRLENSDVKVMSKTKPEEIVGGQFAEGIKVLDLEKNEEKTIEADGIFVEIGKKPNTAFLKDSGLKLEKGYVAVDEEQKTNIPGIFAAGDVTTNKVKQLGVAVAQGSVAALSAYDYIKRL
ncbi:MAG: thioredoxin-disulfide reductase [Candidatus Hydrothermarchaeales archaeon]